MNRKSFSVIFSLVISVFALGFLSSCSSYASDFNLDDYKALGLDFSNEDDTIVITPQTYSAALIFYPGGAVSYESYIPIMSKVALKGCKVFIVQFPQDLAILDYTKASRVRANHPEIGQWYLGGHSLGGAMAASCIASHTSDYTGLLLLAAYSTADLTSSGLKVLTLYGTNDGVLNMTSYNKYRKNLPSSTTEYAIPGGNHGQFGNYGNQKGDNEASITREEQQDLTANLFGYVFFGIDFSGNPCKASS